MQTIRLIDFTDCPGVDFIHTGPLSGQWFANLIASNLMGQRVLLDIDYTNGVHPNFLEGIIDTLLEFRIDIDSIDIKSDEEPENREFWFSYVRYMKKRMEGVNFDNDIERHQFWDKYFFYKVGHNRDEVNKRTAVRIAKEQRQKRNKG